MECEDKNFVQINATKIEFCTLCYNNVYTISRGTEMVFASFWKIGQKGVRVFGPKQALTILTKLLSFHQPSHISLFYSITEDNFPRACFPSSFLGVSQIFLVISIISAAPYLIALVLLKTVMN